MCIILPQMSGYIKYFDNGGKNMKILNKIKDILSVKFHSQPKVKSFSTMINALFSGNAIPKQRNH